MKIMSDDGIKTGKSTAKGKTKAGSKKSKEFAPVEVDIEEQVDLTDISRQISDLWEIKQIIRNETS